MMLKGILIGIVIVAAVICAGSLYCCCAINRGIDP